MIKQRNLPPIKAEEFWDAALRWNQWAFHDGANNAHDEGRKKLRELMASDRLNFLPLGKLRGETRLGLIPCFGCLPVTALAETEVPNINLDFDFAQTSTKAVAYPDGHPSEEQIHLRVKPVDDDRLRRCSILGFVTKTDKYGYWQKTGHVLVMDMDVGRQHHPWFILASEWPNDFENVPWDGDEMVRAEKKVARDDPLVHGVFPGDRNHTPIARLRHYGTAWNKSRPFILQFGEGFQFDLDRFGGDRRQEESQYGPDLATVMDWFEDLKTHEEVCFMPGGKEYMRYDRQLKTYTYPSDVSASFVGQVSYEGEVDSGPTSLASRPRNVSFGDSPRGHHQESQSSTAGSLMSRDYAL